MVFAGFFISSARLVVEEEEEATGPTGDTSTALGRDDPAGVYFSNDGLTMYICDDIHGSTNGVLYQYPLTTAWDLSTVGSSNASFTNGKEFSDFTFNYDGTEIYILMARAHSSANIAKYTMTTAFDISTKVYSWQWYRGSSGTLNWTDGLDYFEHGSGKYLLVGEGVDGNQYLYKFDITNTPVGTIDSNWVQRITYPKTSGNVMLPGGFKIYSTGTGTDTNLYIYELTTSYDLTTATLLSTTNVGFELGGIYIRKSDLSKMYLCNIDTNAIVEYNISEEFQTVPPVQPSDTNGAFDIRPFNNAMNNLSSDARGSIISRPTFTISSDTLMNGTTGDVFNITSSGSSNNYLVLRESPGSYSYLTTSVIWKFPSGTTTSVFSTGGAGYVLPIISNDSTAVVSLTDAGKLQMINSFISTASATSAESAASVSVTDWNHTVLVIEIISGTVRHAHLYMNGLFQMTHSNIVNQGWDKIFFFHDVETPLYTDFVVQQVKVWEESFTEGEVAYIYNEVI